MSNNDNNIIELDENGWPTDPEILKEIEDAWTQYYEEGWDKNEPKCDCWERCQDDFRGQGEFIRDVCCNK